MDAPVSTIASPKIHVLLFMLDTSRAPPCVLVRVPVSCVEDWVTTMAVLVIRPVGNSKFPTVGSYVRGCPLGPENDDRYDLGVFRALDSKDSWILLLFSFEIVRRDFMFAELCGCLLAFSLGIFEGK